MKNITFTLTSLFFIFNYSFSQSFDWANTWGFQVNGSIGGVNAMDVATDVNGNSYTLSTGTTQVDFDPNPPVLLGPSAACGAVTKFDPNGNVVWVKFITKIGGPSSGISFSSIYLKNGFIYFGGNYNGTYDFDASGVTNSLNGVAANFIAKWDLDGNYQWAKSFGSNGTTINDINVDGNGEVFFTGSFNSSISFPGAGFINTIGGLDIFVCKLDNLGNGVWIYSYGSLTDDEGYGITSTSTGNVYLTGHFRSTVDFDPSASLNNKTSAGGEDIFLQKIDGSGNIVWTQTFGSTGDDRGLCITSDGDDNIILSGAISGIVDFDISTNNFILSAPSYDTYICKFNENSSLIWAKMISGPGGNSNISFGISIVSDVNNSLYVAGRFAGIIDFDPSNSVYDLTSSSNGTNTYVLKVYGNGNFAYAGALTGTSPHSNWPNGIAVNVNQIFVAGQYEGVVDFDPSSVSVSNINSATNSNTVPYYSAYVLNLQQCTPSTSSINENSCGAYTAPDGIIYTSNGVYQSVIANTTGCDSIITINLTINENTTNTISETGCMTFTAPDGQIYTQSGIYSATIPNNAGCDSLISINLTIKQNSSSTISETVCKTYTAPDGQIYTQSGIYSATIPNNAGCDSLMTINLTVNNVNTAVSVSGITLTAEANGLQYQWINCLNNQLISGANAQSYTPIANGDYAVILIDGNCSDTSLCSSISSVSIGEITSNNLKVAPNPTSNNLVISGISSSTNTKLELCAITGELISTYSVEGSEIVLNLSSLPSGVYFIRYSESFIRFIKE
jgi:hypothetical protein